MPIPYHDQDEIEELGSAAFLKVIANGGSSVFQAALFLINARGEPLEFTYNQVDIPHTFLWRRQDIRRHALRKLVASLLTICPKVPRLLLCLAEEVESELFGQDIQLSIPVCRIAPAMGVSSYSSHETRQTVEATGGATREAAEPMHIFWFPGRPAEDSEEVQLLTLLVSHALLREPFERAATGLREVYRREEEVT